MTEHLVFRQIQQLPEHLKQEVLDFVGYLLSKYALIVQKPLPLTALPPKTTKPAFGCGRVKLKMAPDFDAPLEDFKEYSPSDRAVAC
jgi:hypothetical protein